MAATANSWTYSRILAFAGIGEKCVRKISEKEEKRKKQAEQNRTEEKERKKCRHNEKSNSAYIQTAKQYH